MEHIIKIKESHVTLHVNAGVILDFKILFEDRDDVRVIAEGDLSEYSVDYGASHITIQSIERSVISMPKMSAPILECLIIAFPKQSLPTVRLRAIDSCASFEYTDTMKFSGIHIDGVGLKTYFTHVTTPISFNAVNSSLNIDNYSGNIDGNGLSMMMDVKNLKDMSVRLNGVATQMMVHEGNKLANYNIEMLGLKSSITYHDSKRTGMGRLTYATPVIAEAPRCLITGTGVKTRVIIQ